MIELVISGGQAGADMGGWRAAKKAGIRTMGWLPKGFLTEEGSRPEYARLYGAQEHHSSDYPARTRMNIMKAAEEAGGLIIFDAGDRMSPGTRLANGVACDLIARGFTLTVLVLKLAPYEGTWRVANSAYRPPYAAKVFRNGKVNDLCVAGNRESKAPGIGAYVERYLTEVFRLMRSEP